MLTLALLFAQFGAEVHAYSHLAKDQGIPGSPQRCVTCLSFAPVTMAVGGSLQAVLIDYRVSEPVLPLAAVSISDSSPYSAFQPRAPPQLL